MSVATLLSVCLAVSTGCYHPSKAVTPTVGVIDSAVVVVSSLSAEEALYLYQERAQRQLCTLAEYSDDVTIEANVPANSTTGEVSLREMFAAAPRKLSYTAVQLSGDGFINNNVITRILESQADHVRKGMELRTAILDSNYKFSYKGVADLQGRSGYRFAVVPRYKVTGLFKGEILLDPRTGHILSASGRLSKSPSWWIKRIEFTQDYADVGEFTLPVYISTMTQARFIGRVVVTIRHRDYEVRAARLERIAGGHAENICQGDGLLAPEFRLTPAVRAVAPMQ